MEQINDLKTDLNEEIDLSKHIKLILKISKKKEKKLEDLDSKKKSLNLKIKHKIKVEKIKNKNFDTIFEKKLKNIDLNTEDKKDFLKKKVATTVFKIKNIEFKNIKENFKNFSENNFFKESKNRFKNFYKNNLEKTNKKFDIFKVSFFIVLVLFIWLLDKIIVETLVKTSYSNLMLVKDNIWNLEKSKKLISSSKTRLFIAEILFSPFSILPMEKVKNVNHIIDWWQNVTELLTKSINLYENIDKKVKENPSFENIYFTNILEEVKGNYDEINNLLVKTYLEYNKITDLWDDSLNEKLFWVKQKLNLALISLDKINKNYDILLSILWEFKNKKYLVVFQNNDEIRATWGFIGSLAILDMERWKVKKLEKKDVYALEWQLNQVYKDKEKAPAWLAEITPTFGLRDANYFPEFKDSSAKIKFFLDKINLEVDGIIYINQNVILDLIKTTGWVYSETFKKEINEENFSFIVSTLVEAEVFREWTLWSPKQALFSFSEELFKKLNSDKKYYEYLKIILEHIKTRDIVVYSFNPTENSFLWKMWLNWEINFRQTLDFNYPIYTSIWWNKSDRYLDYRYEKTVSKINNSCDLLVNLKIFNTHNFSEENEENVKNLLQGYNNLWKKLEDIINIQWKWYNRSYLRILIPKEAEAILMEWQEVVEHSKYKSINFLTLTKPWQTTNYEINYRLIREDCRKDYSFKFFKQPWIKNYQILFDVFGKQTDYSNIKTDFIYKD